jgi:hypothetical protein
LSLWSATLREEHILTVHENRVLRTFEPRRVEVAGWWRMRWTERVAHTGKMRNAYKILVGIPEGKRPLGRPRH